MSRVFNTSSRYGVFVIHINQTDGQEDSCMPFPTVLQTYGNNGGMCTMKTCLDFDRISLLKRCKGTFHVFYHLLQRRQHL